MGTAPVPFPPPNIVGPRWPSGHSTAAAGGTGGAAMPVVPERKAHDSGKARAAVPATAAENDVDEVNEVDVVDDIDAGQVGTGKTVCEDCA